MNDKADICASITVNVFRTNGKENYNSQLTASSGREVFPKRHSSASPRLSTRNSRGSKQQPLDELVAKIAPKELTAPQYDAMLIYTPQDEDDMIKFRYILENLIILENKTRPSVCLCNCDDSANFQSIMDNLQRTSNVFVYSKNGRFGNRCSSHKKDEIITRCLHRPDTRLIPVLPSSDHDATVGLRALRPLFLKKLLDGKSIETISIKELEFSNEDVLDKSEQNALKRLLNAGITTKQNRILKQQQSLRAWHREYVRNRQIENALQQRNQEGNRFAQTNPTSQPETDNLKNSNDSALAKRVTKSHTVLHEVPYSSKSNSVERTVHGCQEQCSCCQGQRSRCHGHSTCQVRHKPCRFPIENNEVETYDRDSC